MHLFFSVFGDKGLEVVQAEQAVQLDGAAAVVPQEDEHAGRSGPVHADQPDVRRGASVGDLRHIGAVEAIPAEAEGVCGPVVLPGEHIVFRPVDGLSGFLFCFRPAQVRQPDGKPFGGELHTQILAFRGLDQVGFPAVQRVDPGLRGQLAEGGHPLPRACAESPAAREILFRSRSPDSPALQQDQQNARADQEQTQADHDDPNGLFLFMHDQASHLQGPVIQMQQGPKKLQVFESFFGFFYNIAQELSFVNNFILTNKTRRCGRVLFVRFPSCLPGFVLVRRSGALLLSADQSWGCWPKLP